MTTANVHDDFPVSFAQRRLWFFEQLAPGSAAYNMPAAWRLRGTLRPDVLAAALGEVVARHESLRTSFVVVDGEVVQRVGGEVALDVPVVDVADEDEARRVLAAEAARPFDLESGLLLRARILRLGPDDHVLVVVMHHIAADGWSFSVLLREIDELYGAFAAGRPSPLPDLAVQYADFATWQRDALDEATVAGHLDYWRTQLAGAPSVMEVCADRLRPAMPSFAGDAVDLALPASSVESLRELAGAEGATLFMALLALFSASLCRSGAGPDVCVGSPIAGRSRPELEPLIGFFVNTLVLRTDCSGDPSLRELLARARSTVLDAFAHQDLPFDRLVEDLAPDRDVSRNPLVQTMFQLFSTASDGALMLTGIRCEPFRADVVATRFDIEAQLFESRRGVGGAVFFATDLFDRETIERLVGRFVALVEAAAAQPDVALSQLAPVDAAERDVVVHKWNATDRPAPSRLVPELVEAHARRDPARLAVANGDAGVGYGELVASADRLAARLREVGVVPGSVVGVLAPRGAALLTALLAAWRVGAAYLPLDADHPDERLAFMLADAEAAVLLTTPELADRVTGARLVLDIEAEADGGEAATAQPPAALSPADVAYVIYTSGSTGAPKGVAITHGSLANLVDWHVAEYRLVPADRVSMAASNSFDASVWETWTALGAGATLDVVPVDVRRDGRALGAWLEARRTTVAFAATPLADGLFDHAWPADAALRLLLVGGDRLVRRPPATAPFTLVNNYGPTEITVLATAGVVEAEGVGVPSIGAPVANTRVYVLDGFSEPVPIGVAGELFVGGAGLARGYVGQPALTADRFVPNPFAAAPGERLYRTGDRVRWTADGSLEFLGRLDRQVKIRGYRIELGEIEAALAADPDVAEAVVVAGSPRGDTQLFAYVVPADGGCDPAAVRDRLRGRLPSYMVPASVTVLAALPLNANGKLDRAALPDPATATQAAFVPPRSPAEELVAGVFSSVLGVAPVGADDDFFDLGGHSLLATQVVSRIREVFGCDVPLRLVFETPTVAALAVAVEDALRGEARPPLVGGAAGPDAPLSFAQQRLWFLDQLVPDNPFYNIVGVWRLRGPLDVDVLAAALTEVVARHEALRTAFALVDGAPVQRVVAAEPVAIAVDDVEGDEQARDIVAEEAARPFDLAGGSLLRARVARLSDDEHVLVLAMHHIASDGWSLGVLLGEVAALYAAFVEGEESPLPPLRVQYGDFSVWQRSWLTGDVLDAQLAYWRNRLTGMPPALDLVTDHPRPAAPSFVGGAVPVALPAEVVEQLRDLAREQGATLYMTLLGAFSALLARYGAGPDVAVGSPMAGRTNAELESMIGFFVNTLVMRTDCSGDPTFRQLVSRARETALGAYSHHDLPFEHLVEELAPVRDLSRNPLVQVMFQLFSTTSHGALDLAGVACEPFRSDVVTTRFDIELQLTDTPSGVSGAAFYAADLFERATVERMLGHFVALLRAVAASPDQPLSELAVMDESERAEVLTGWNQTERPLPFGTVVDAIDHHAAAQPHAAAVVAEDGDLTFAELVERSERLAGALWDAGVRGGDVVAVRAPRGSALTSALLAIWKAGAAYLPLDDTLPSERAEFMLADARVHVLLTPAARAADVPAGIRALALDEPDSWAHAGAAGRRTQPNPADLAYVMYTSGSTGVPKGVAVPHAAVARLAFGLDADLGPGRRVLQAAPVAFDASTFEVWATLANGGTSVVLTGRPEPDAVRGVVRSHGVDVAWLTAALFNTIVDDDPASLKGLSEVWAGGEALSPPHVAAALRACPGLRIVNGYGPTECTTFTACHPVASPPAAAVPIGRPVGNTEVFVLDGFGVPVPVGVPGELFVGGPGLAWGYLARAAMTAETFVPHPFASDPGRRLYRTGDRVRWNARGELEFLGRVDRQVKLRGFRIELGEIETAAVGHPLVAEAAVVVREDVPGDRRLVAYVVPSDDAVAADDLATSHVGAWQATFDDVYASGSGGTFDTVGWNSSYTGEAIADDEMREWVDATVERIRGLGGSRVLEIGCGTGLLLFELAPSCERYVGTDFSRPTIDALAAEVRTRGLDHVELAACEADDETAVEQGAFDVVVVNSVVQYFPSRDYLDDVIAVALKALAPGGRLFLGDIRSAPLLDAFHASVVLSQAEPVAARAALRAEAARNAALEDELTVDPAHLCSRPGVAHVEVLAKRGRAANEMTRFRYDAVLAKAPSPAPVVADRWLPWRGVDDLRARLAGDDDVVAVAGVPNARVSADVAAAAWLAAADGPGTLAGWLAAPAPDAVDPEALVALAADAGYEARISVAGSADGGTVDVAFLRRGSAVDGVPVAFPVAAPAAANDPLRGRVARAAAPVLVPALREALKLRLPDHMVPGAIVVLDALPLTANGKVDRNALPVPVDTGVTALTLPRSPVEEVLADVFASVLGLARIGADDDFFDLGGHSLLATRVITRVREVFACDLPLRALFEHPTVAGLAVAVEDAVRTGSRDRLPPLVAGLAEAEAPLSFAQQRLWFLDQLVPDNPFYNMAASWVLRGALDANALDRALTEVVARHQTLRTAIVTRGDMTVQRVVDVPADGVVRVVDVSSVAEAAELAAQEAERPFDLASGQLLRATLARVSPDEHVLVLVMHHVSSDGWSLGVLLRELTALYEAFAAGGGSPLAPLPVQYADFAVWQRSWLSGDLLDAQLAYWRDRLAGAPTAVELPTDRPRPAAPSFRGATVPLVVPDAVVEQLRAVARGEGATLFMALLAGFSGLLARYGAGSDTCIGTPVAGRTRSELEGLIGFFVNTLVLRTDTSGDPTFRELLARVRETSLGAYANQDVPFEQLVEELAPVRDLSRNPLVQIAFQLFAVGTDGTLDLAGVEAQAMGKGLTSTRFDIEMQLLETTRGVGGALAYAVDLFDHDTAERLVSHYLSLLASAAAEPDTPLSQLAAASGPELSRVAGFSTGGHAARPTTTVPAAIAAQAAVAPDAVAVVDGDVAVTFAALMGEASRIGAELRRAGVVRGDVVAVVAPRAAASVAAFLGVWSVGAAYVPIDPETPEERARFVMGDAKATALVTPSALADRFASPLPRVVAGEPGQWRPAPEAVGAGDATPDGLAYLIYTSGSTGAPKGVAVDHAALAAYVDSQIEQLAITADDRMCGASSFTFDASVFEVWLPLCAGGSVDIVPPDVRLDPAALARWIDERGATAGLIVTPVGEPLTREEWPATTRFRLLVVGGERLVSRPPAGMPFTVVNAYGPTETTVIVTHGPVSPEGERLPSIGKPVPNARVYVLDGFLSLQPIGVPGELFVGGPQVTRGYMGRPALTAERFVPDPFSDEPGARLYRTGDRVRWNGDGEIEFLGRVDRQVKVRGHRIELGEIEAALSAQAEVRDAAVVVREDDANGPCLVAYATAAAGADPLDPATLREALRLTLPGYMVPATIVVLDELPLTTSGKLDRNALPAPGWVDEGSRVEPRTPVEEALAAIWADVLGVERVGVEDDFFDLGGHSLLATQVVGRVREAFDVDVPLRALFEEPTVAGFAPVVEDALRSGAAARPPLVAGLAGADEAPLSFAQQRLWFLHQLVPDNAFYNMPGVWRLRGALDTGALAEALSAVVSRHAALRTSFTEAEGGAVVQRVRPAAPVAVPVVDVADEAAAAAVIEREAATPFDLTSGSLLRARVARLAPDDHVLIVVMHHIASDGWSFGIVLAEIAALYDAFAAGRPSPLADLDVQYADFAVWQRSWLVDDVLDEQLAYWRDRLAGAPPAIDLPTDKPRPPVPSFDGDAVPVSLPSDVVARLREVGGDESATLFMVLLAGFSALLARLGAGPDVCVGSPIAGRTTGELERMVGFFVNTLVMRTDCSGDPTFRQLVDRAATTALEAYAHQDLPFEQLVEELAPERDLSRNPLVQVVFQLFASESRGLLDLDGVRCEPFRASTVTTRFDIEVQLVETASGVDGAVFFATDLFDRSTIERLVGHFVRLLTEAAAAPDAPLSAITFLGPDEIATVVDGWNSTALDVPSETVVAAVARQAALHPATAAVAEGDVVTTYRQLDDAATALASTLDGMGVGRGSVVAVLAPRGGALAAGLLGVWKAGAAYVPLDPDHPGDRIRFMVEDSGASAVLATAAHAGRLPADGPPVLVLPDPAQSPGSPPGAAPQPPTGDDLAYVIYTSGSTGTPKGVAVAHASVQNLVTWHLDAYGVGAGDRVSWIANVSFDASAWELWPALATGATVDVVPDAVRADAPALARWLCDRRIAVAFVPTPLAEPLLALDWDDDAALHLLLTGGDRLVSSPPEGSPFELVNHYGPTESTVVATAATVDQTPSVPPIGRPIANTSAYVLDGFLEPVAVGAPGELYIGGAGLARGYVGRAGLTADRFVPNPFAAVPGERMYRTGDRVRWSATGELYFLGRLDDQVKLRGYRIELGEIEAAINAHPRVAEAVVSLRDRGASGAALTAYVVPAADADGVADAHVGDWKAAFDEVYAQAPGGEFDIVGWHSSYTGEAIPAAEMREWVDETVARIRSMAPRRVLEIGCGTGLLLFELAAATDRYVATDFSRATIDALSAQVASAGLDQVELVCGEADDLDGIDDGAFDVVVVNSVVQYFPSSSYLERVVAGALRKLVTGGRLFVGDVRNAALLEAFHVSVAVANAEDASGRADVAGAAARELRVEDELAVLPSFFTDWVGRDGVAHAAVLAKRGTADNEMTRFRYDAVLTTEPMGAAVVRPTWEPYAGLAEIERRLAAGDDMTAAAGVPNARVAGDMAALEWLADEDAGTVGDLRAQAAPHAVHPEELWSLGERYGYDAVVSVAAAADGATQDVAFVRREPGADGVAVEAPVAAPGGDAANDPLRARLARLAAAGLEDDVREHLRLRLPEYMVPSDFVVLDAIPLTANGKVDRAALPTPERETAGYVEPRTATEELVAGLYATVLGRTRVGAHDHFFDLGGHSLVATQVVTRLRDALGYDVSLRSLFEAPTVAGLAAAVDAAIAAGSAAAAPALTGGLASGDAPLSFAQQRLWFLDQLMPGNALYNSVATWRLRGGLDASALASALSQVVERHESLRTAFATVDGEPVQRVTEPRPLDVPVVDVADEAEARGAVRVEAATPFDLSSGSLLRARLLRLAPEEHVLVVAMHHIASDGWSIGVLLHEVAALYAAAVRGAPSPLAPLPVQYADFAVWQRDWLEGDVLDAQLAYWRDRLEGMPTVIDLPTDRPRPALASFRGGAVPLAVPDDVADALRAIARDENATLFMALLAGYSAVLARYAGNDDVAVGTPVAGRTRSELEAMIGFFVNTLVMRVDCSGDPTFRQLVARARETALGAYTHQDLPFEHLVGEVSPERDASRNPLVQVMLQLFSTSTSPGLQLPGLDAEPFGTDASTTRLDLELQLAETDDGVSGAMYYARDLFEHESAERMVAHLLTLLARAAADPDRPLSEIDMADAHESAAVDALGRGPVCPAPAATVPERVAAFAAAHPEAPAVLSGDVVVTFGELVEQAGCIARRLIAAGVGRGGVVAVCGGREPATIAALLGAWSAGAAYLPLDPAYPDERLRFMVDDCDAVVVMATPADAGRFPGRAVLDITEPPGPDGGHAHGAPIESGAAAKDLAYVIYTSGSTGVPKGVAISHASLAAFIDVQAHALAITPEDRIACAASFAFDASVCELWSALAAGAAAILVPSDVRLDPASLVEWTADSGVTVALNITAVGQPMLAQAWPAHSRLRTMLVGGDRLTARPPAGVPFTVMNSYGPTETTVVAAQGAVAPEGDTAPALGTPIGNVRVHVLDPFLRQVPRGVPGELFVGGPQVGTGYVARPALTAERFVPDPFADEPGSRLYRTGDRVRWTTAGELEFLGRRDNQVKVRGYRIELGEVEHAVTSVPGVQQAVVTATGERLVAYVVPVQADAAARTLTAAVVKDAVRTRLPEHMVPSAVVVLDRLPLTVNGKVDHAALPAPDYTSTTRVAPRSATEQVVADIWADVLGLDAVGVDDDFFDIGGHSLLATKAMAKVREAFDRDVPLRTLFDSPTVAGLAAAIDGSTPTGVADVSPVALMEADAASARGVDLTPAAPAAAPSRPAHVLLTGATGFVGAFLLDELLSQTDATVHCLVRAADEDAAMARLEAAALRFRLPAVDRQRVCVVVGDLVKPAVGLDEACFERLSGLVDAVYHCGADVNFLHRYEHLRAANVLATKELVRLSARRGAQVNLVSTAAVVPWLGRALPVREDDEGSPTWVQGGYAQSKYVAEQVVLAAGDAGLPVAVFRLPRVAPHSSTGVWNDDDVLARLVRGTVELGALPSAPWGEIWVPVDRVAADVVAASLCEAATGQVLHVMDGPVVTFADIAGWLSDAGVAVETVPLHDWAARVLDQPDNPAYAAVGLFDVAGDIPDLDPAAVRSIFPEHGTALYDCTNLRTALAGRPARAPIALGRSVAAYATAGTDTNTTTTRRDT